VLPAGSEAKATAQAGTPTQPAFTDIEEALLNAQDAGDAQALGAALAAGANPNLLSPSGSSMLMLAAHRGQLEHIELLLQAGADPDMRQTRKDSERGDTALLRAFYGGQLAAAQRLVQAGARLDARNRWDWGVVHMAAQSGCVPCLQWLAERGQALDAPAPASRGETPAMLAAAKGRILALE
jgi:ankyrin repeat protein